MRELPLKQNNNKSNLSKLFEDEAFGWQHSFWVKKLAIELFTMFEADPLAQVAAKQTQFSAAMIPLLVKVLLTTKNSDHRVTLNYGMSQFFSNSFKELSAVRSQVNYFVNLNFE